MSYKGYADTPRARRGGEIATVAGAFVAYGSIFFDRLAPLYLVALIAQDLGVPSAYEGTLALLIGLGWAAAMPLVRASSGRLGDRDRVITGAVVAGLLGIASAGAGGWVAFLAFRGFGGMAAASGSPAATALVFAAAPPRRRGLDLGILLSSTRLVGSLVSPVVVTAVTVAAGWRTAMVVSGVVLLAGAALLALAVPGEPRTVRSGRAAVTFAWLPDGRRNVTLCTVACVVLLAWLTVWSQSSVPLVQRWLVVDADAAGRLVSLFGLGAGAASLLVPLWSDRIGRRVAFAAAVVTGGAGGLAVGVLAAHGTTPPRPVAAAFLVLAGVAMGGLPLVISIIPAEAVATGDVARALVGPIAGGEVLGSAALPTLAAILAVPLGHGAVVAGAATGVLGLVTVAALLRPVAHPS